MNLFCFQPDHPRNLFRSAESVLRHYRKAVEVGPVERRNVYRRDNVRGQDAPQRFIQRHSFHVARREVDRGAKAPLCFVAIQNL